MKDTESGLPAELRVEASDQKHGEKEMKLRKMEARRDVRDNQGVVVLEGQELVAKDWDTVTFKFLKGVIVNMFQRWSEGNGHWSGISVETEGTMSHPKEH